MRGPVFTISTGFTTTSFGGTLRYLVPEQMLSDYAGPTAQTDIYAFGYTCAEVRPRTVLATLVFILSHDRF